MAPKKKKAQKPTEEELFLQSLKDPHSVSLAELREKPPELNSYGSQKGVAAPPPGKPTSKQAKPETEEDLSTEEIPVQRDVAPKPAKSEWFDDGTGASPQNLAEWRKQKAYDLARDTRRAINESIVESLLLNPDSPRLFFNFGNEPEDVVAYVIQGLQTDGWVVYFDAEKQIQLDLPLVENIAAPIARKHVSVVQPL